MRFGHFLIRAGIFLFIIGFTSLVVYYASIFEPIRRFYIVASTIVLCLSFLSVLLDETIGNAIGNIKPEIIRGVGFLFPAIVVIVSYLIGKAINWTVLIRVIEFTFLGLITLAILGGILILWLKLKGNQGQQQNEPSTYTNPFLPR